jgi:hypothetical protein
LQKRVERIVIGLTFAAIVLNGYISMVLPEHSWSWTLILLAIGLLLLGANRVIVSLYIKYSPSCFSRTPPIFKSEPAAQREPRDEGSRWPNL